MSSKNKPAIQRIAELCHAPSSLLFFSCVAASLLFISHAGNLSFAFPPSKNFKIENDAYFQGDKLIQLTKNEATGNLNSSLGWASYNKSVPLWDNSSQAQANFSTHFQFIIGKGNNIQRGFGDGLAFFMAPFDLEQPLDATGGGIGLFNATTYKGSFYQMVAVEFDTYQNGLDPDENHVGVDVNDIFSKVNVSVTSIAANSTLCDESLNNEKRWDAWVYYDGSAKRLQVFLCYSWELSAVATPTSSPNVNTSSSRNPRNSEKKKCYFWVILIVVIICSALAICGFVFIGWWRYFRKSKPGGEATEESDVELDQWLSQAPRKFSYAVLCTATRNFSESGKPGQGGCGGVYKGILPGTKDVVAIKKVSPGSSQGRKEYVSEVTIMSRLRHRNLVQLLGWCHRKGELLLVYEYLPNSSLDNYFFGEKNGVLDCNRRYNIACDVASLFFISMSNGTNLLCTETLRQAT
ncbi:L-type lectin-domain containing receptor kinase IX.1-like [Cryptomeria japonica]|uniref:L-type lectin-domain containing receptor kinase IX.1-like n=1 Tax=Cryptomeria japonica TaxID=3369 RepID=UPI0027DA2612|nr:L-type lectin-domain containing receptor kinase IX.1-like [Cryptomeria japonica]